MGPIRTGHFWRFHPGQSVDISNLSPQQKDEGTEKQRRGLDFGQKSSQAAKTFMITEPQPNPSPQRKQGAQRQQGKEQTGGLFIRVKIVASCEDFHDYGAATKIPHRRGRRGRRGRREKRRQGEVFIRVKIVASCED